MAPRPSRSDRWNRKRRGTSTASTERWPTPSAATGEGGDGRRRRDAALWRSVAYLTSLGWIIVLPIAAGLLLGRLIDTQLGSEPYATLTLLGVGIGVACLQGYLAAARALGHNHHDGH